MNTQFVDLFDRKKYGFNYLAIIFLILGSLMGWLLVSGWHFIIGEYRISTSWIQFFVPMLANWLVFALLTIGACHFLKKDLLLPVVVGVGMVVWRFLFELIGINPASEFAGLSVLVFFAWQVLVLGAVVLAYQKMENKLGAIIWGFVVGSLLGASISGAVHWYSVEGFILNISSSMFDGFIIAVFLFAGIALHFKKQGKKFDEFGFCSTSEAGRPEQGAGQTGKVRAPLTTMLLAAVTLNIYIFGWIYKVYSEIRAHSPQATTITPGQAVGFLFIPLFNFYWVVRLFIDLPRAIQRMQGEHPPPGKSPNTWLITGLLFAAVITGIVGAYMEPQALYLTLNQLFLWWGILLAQSSVNSHWRLHQEA